MSMDSLPPDPWFFHLGSEAAAFICGLFAWLMKRKPEPPRQVRAEELAVRLGTSAATVHEWGRQGRFPRTRRHGVYFYDEQAAIEMWRSQHGDP
jgi:predicted DNA-binding transcriptional regulator AlpA